jgi:hypothetical protein
LVVDRGALARAIAFNAWSSEGEDDVQNLRSLMEKAERYTDNVPDWR